MTSIAVPFLFCLFVWWFSTGVILYLDGLPQRTFRWSLIAASGLAAAALYGIAISSSDDSTRGAYLAFTCALALWGWHEMSFLMGLLTGPRRTACPTGATGWLRLRYAIETIAYHELAIAGTAIVLAALTATGSNRLALWTFLVLWAMRISAKINVFLGVPNLSENWLPKELQFLQSYFRKAPMNMFFPVTVTVATIATVLLAQAAFSPALTHVNTTGLMLLTVLMGLAVLEHWFLVLPFPFAAIWAWGLGSRELVAMRPIAEAQLPGHTKHTSGLVSGPTKKRAHAA